jgi:hypothetical protein
MEWIRVDDRLPESDWSPHCHTYSGEVLIWNRVAIEKAFFNRRNGTWYTGELADENWIDDVTHWQLLPEPPEE